MALTAALVCMLALPGEGPLDWPSIARNGSASVLVSRAIVLGIDFDPHNKKTEHSTPAEVDAFNQAAAFSWLGAQLEAPDDSIGSPPPALRQFLEGNSEALGAIVAALEKEAPEWSRKDDETGFPELAPTIRLQRVLLAAALIAEGDGDAISASRALEASWSLSRPVAGYATLIHQLLASAIARWQAGALRKIKEPSLAWLGRLSADATWRQMLEGLGAEAKFFKGEDGLLATDPLSELSRRVPEIVAEAFGKISPCEAAALEEDAVWSVVEQELPMRSRPREAETRQMYREDFLPAAVNAVKRAARAAVDRELSLEILQLRLEKSGDRDGKWPPKLEDAVSRVCPSVSYVYRTEAGGMEIEFGAAIADPGTGLALPLKFRSFSPPPTPTPLPTPAAALTRESGGGMISPK